MVAVEREVVAGPAGPIEVRCCGAGPLVVLLASLGRSASDFDELAGRLAAAGYRAAAPEPRGIGATEGLAAGLTMADLAADVAAVVRRLAPEARATVLGHAFGNRVARMLATTHPDLVDGVVLLACGGLVPPGDAAARALRAVFDPSLDEESHLAAVRAAFFAPGGDASVWRGGWHRDVAGVQSQAAQGTEVGVWWTAGVAPVLVVQAEHDVIATAANAEALVEAIGARATVVMVEDAGHALLPEQPGPIADAVIGWLAGRR